MAQKYRFHEPKDVKYTTNENTNAQQSIYKNSYVACQNLAHCAKWQKLCLHHMLSQLYMDEIIISQPMYPIHLTLASFHRHLQLNYTTFTKQLTYKCFLALTTSQPRETPVLSPEPFLLFWSVCFVLILQKVCLEGPPGSYWKGEQRWLWQLQNLQLLHQERMTGGNCKRAKVKKPENKILFFMGISLISTFSGRF